MVHSFHLLIFSFGAGSVCPMVWCLYVFDWYISLLTEFALQYGVTRSHLTVENKIIEISFKESSQCTSPEHPVSHIEPICFTYDNLHVSMPFSHIIPPSPSPIVQKTVQYICVSFAVSRIGSSLPSF